MLSAPSLPAALSTRFVVRHVRVTVETTRPVEIVDLTGTIAATVGAFGLCDGTVTIQTRHTTTGLLINEHEPLLLEDLVEMFDRLAPSDRAYAHDDFGRRVVNLMPGERRNGHAHCRAAFLRTSEVIAVSAGELMLGRWQRVMLVEFDGSRSREVSVTLMGEVRRR
jgi:secondary thiamine-phosphate synthase enzyme